MNVLEILKAHLLEVGADGLAYDDCGCGIDDLQPCGSYCMSCVPAKSVIDHDADGLIYVAMDQLPPRPTPTTQEIRK